MGWEGTGSGEGRTVPSRMGHGEVEASDTVGLETESLPCPVMPVLFPALGPRPKAQRAGRGGQERINILPLG